MLDMPRVREVFEASTDFTVGIEEEFAILDPRTLSLDHRFEELRERRAGRPGARRVGRRRADPLRDRDPLGPRRDVRGRGGEAARRALAAVRAGCAERRAARRDRHASVEPLAGAADHRHRALPARQDSLQYVAWRNNTFSLHVHVGVRGAERAVRVCDRLRSVMPELLAISANSPFLDGRHSGLHSARSQIFTKSFPRCGIPDPFGGWQAYADYIDFLVRTQLDHGVHAGVVERAAAPFVRHGRDADLRRAGERGGLDGACGADHLVRGPGRARPRRGRAVRGPAAAR